MPAWLSAFFQWVRAEPSRPMFLGMVTILGLGFIFRALYRGLEQRIAARLERQQAQLVELHVNTTSQEIRMAARDIMSAARDNRIPIQVVAGSEEEAEGLRQILERPEEPAIEYPPPRPRARRTRQTPPSPDRESAPTAWTRILADDEDEKEAPCPTNETPEPPPKKAKAKSKRTH